ncbi:MAG: hypothetical protein JWP26_1895 [Devosia sp.]|uniref:hypothetical protein n=1 Tax=Devosia sp. TaxID=1871048 RepID=UPI002636F91A|nr:hypothetical protein [Devosia sp.]MDB5586925.1 hypothetical protein [Devosia sp.]
MTMMPAKFKSVIRAAIVVLALGGSAIGTIPAQAQQGLAFSFNLNVPGGQRATTFGGGNGFGPRRHDSIGQRCMTNREIRRGIEANGYERVEIRSDLSRDRVEVAGQNGNWLYSMRVDKCSGEVDRVQRIRRVQGGGFGLQFNFGN